MNANIMNPKNEFQTPTANENANESPQAASVIPEAVNAAPEPPIDPNTATRPHATESASLSEQIDGISRDISGQGEPGTRAPGKRGRHPNSCQCDRCKQRRISSGSNSDDSIQEVKTENDTAASPLVNTATEIFDEETRKEMVSGAVELFEGFGQMLIGGVCDKKGKTPAFRADAEKAACMNPKVKGMIVRGGPILIKKYEEYLKYLPEAAVGGGLLMHACMIGSQMGRIAKS